MVETFLSDASGPVSRVQSATPRWLRTARALALGLATTVFAAVSAHATLTVSQGVSSGSIVVGERTRLTITLSNSSVQEDGAALTNTLPPELRLYNPSFPGYVAPASTCTGAILTPLPGGTDQFSATSLSIPAQSGVVNGSCTISFDITSVTAGTWINVIAANNLTPAAVSDAQQSVLVTALQNPTVSKAFVNSPLTQGLTTTATVTFSNPNSGVNIPLTTFTDNLPANLEVVGVIDNSCGGAGSSTPSSVTLTGGAIPAGSPGTCNLRFTVRGVLPLNTPSQAGVNSLPAGAVGNTRGLTSPLNNTNIAVNSPIALSKGFSVTPLTAGSNSRMTVRITNRSAAPLTGVGLSDVVGGAWPAEVLNAGSIGAGNLAACGAGATLSAGAGGPNGTGFVLAGAEIAANGGECVISFDVTSTTVGTWTNSLPAAAVTNAQGFTSPASAASLNVRNNALTVAKTISPNTVAPGDIATFAVAVTSFNIAPQTSVTFTDTLPAGMVYVDVSEGGVAPTISGGCTFSAPLPAPLVTAPTFGFDFPGAAPGGTTCVVRFTARVPANAAPNTVLTNGSFSAGNTGSGGTVTGSSGTVSLTAVNPLVVTKTFDGVTARQRFQGSPSVAQIVLTNNNFSPLSNVSFTDTLPSTPGQIRVADPANAVSTCGGTVTANPGGTSFSLSGGSLPARGATTPFAAGECSVRVNVVGGTVGVHSNTIPAYNGSNPDAAVQATGTVANQPNTPLFNLNATTATLQYLPALTVAKTFLTNPVQIGGTSRVRITLGNNGTGQLTGVRVTDPLAGTGLLIATPANASTTCAGPTVLNVPAGGDTADITGATLAGTSTCDFLFDVVTSTGTPSVNTLAPGAVSADGGVATTTSHQRHAEQNHQQLEPDQGVCSYHVAQSRHGVAPDHHHRQQQRQPVDRPRRDRQPACRHGAGRSAQCRHHLCWRHR